MRKKNFCTECGKKLTRRHNGHYNAYTGNDVMEYSCTNPKCKDGCSNTGGHYYTLFQQDKCTACGDICYSYLY